MSLSPLSAALKLRRDFIIALVAGDSEKACGQMWAEFKTVGQDIGEPYPNLDRVETLRELHVRSTTFKLTGWEQMAACRKELSGHATANMFRSRTIESRG